MFPDAKIRQQVSDRLGTEFIGTLEEDTIIYTMLDLEQFIGSKIDWVTGKTFDNSIIKTKKGTKFLRKLGIFGRLRLQQTCNQTGASSPVLAGRMLSLQTLGSYTSFVTAKSSQPEGTSL